METKGCHVLYTYEQLKAAEYRGYCDDIKHRVLSRAVRMPNGCLEYRSGALKHKYGVISITPIKHHHKRIPASRAIYMATNQCLDLPGNVFVRHTCDNPACVDILHLFVGSAKDRKAKAHRPHSRHRKLSTEQVQAIRLATGKLSHIAEEYGITIGYVSKLKLRIAKPLIK